MRYRTNETIAALSVVALVGMFVAGNEPVIAPLRGTAAESLLHSLHYENAILFNLCVGFLGGVIVWVLNVLIPERLSDVVAHMQTLSSEVEYLLHKISIDDEEVHAFFKRLSLHTHRLQRLSVYSYDEVKYLGGFIFEVLAAWSIISGYLETDPVAQMIEKI